MRIMLACVLAVAGGCAAVGTQHVANNTGSCDIVVAIAADGRSALYKDLSAEGGTDAVGNNVCVGEVSVAWDASYEARAQTLDSAELRSAIAESVAAYREVLAANTGHLHEMHALDIGIAMCRFESYTTDRAQSTGSMKRVRTAVATGSGDLGGPGYLALLLNRAVALHDVDAAQSLATLFHEQAVAVHGAHTNYAHPGACARVAESAYRNELQTLLRSGRETLVPEIMPQFAFLLGNMPWHISQNDIVEQVISEKLRALDFAAVDRIAAAMGVEHASMAGLAEAALREAYRHAFIERDLSERPANVVAIGEHYGFDERSYSWARTYGYADAANARWASIEAVLPDLPHESRVEVANDRIVGERWSRSITVDTLREVHRFMQLAGVTVPDVRFNLAMALIGSVEAENENLELAVAYAAQHMGVTPDQLWNEDTCTRFAPEENTVRTGAWELRCGDALERARRSARLHPEKIVPLPL
ncbi:MAG: hypothetical protein Q7S96_05055 [bacterium]|nr:hypothetical protein [bacterium]